MLDLAIRSCKRSQVFLAASQRQVSVVCNRENNFGVCVCVCVYARMYKEGKCAEGNVCYLKKTTGDGSSTLVIFLGTASSPSLCLFIVCTRISPRKKRKRKKLFFKFKKKKLKKNVCCQCFPLFIFLIVLSYRYNVVIYSVVELLKKKMHL